MVLQNGQVRRDPESFGSSAPPSYQTTNIYPSAPNERDLLLPPGSSGEPVGRPCSTSPQSTPTSTRTSTIRRWCPTIGAIFLSALLLGICTFVIQRSISTSICDPAVRDRIHQELEIAYANYSRRMDRMQQAWEVEVERQSQLRLEMMDERKQWDAERQAREKVREEERLEEVERRRRERQKEEEEEEKKRAGIRWGELQRSERCLRYGTRRYWSKLQVSEGYHGLKACRETEIEIHGRKLLPTYCEDQGKWGGVNGIWIVDFNEASCGTYWSDFFDEGCTAEGSGLRRVHMRLINYDEKDDWSEMCSSTPAKFNGLSFDGPIYCKNYERGKVFGFWVIEDGACR